MIYFIQSEKGGPIKIGSARSVEYRMSQLQIAHAYPLVCLATMKGGIHIEFRLHEKFKKYRLLGEWFEPADELLEFIKNVDSVDPMTLPERRKEFVPLDIPVFIEELYAAALANDWDYETAAAKFKEALVKRRYSVTRTFRHMKWFEATQKQKFEEKRTVTGLQLDVE